MVNLNLVWKGGEKDEYGLSWAVSLKTIIMLVKNKKLNKKFWFALLLTGHLLTVGLLRAFVSLGPSMVQESRVVIPQVVLLMLFSIALPDQQ